MIILDHFRCQTNARTLFHLLPSGFDEKSWCCEDCSEIDRHFELKNKLQRLRSAVGKALSFDPVGREFVYYDCALR